MLVEKVDVEEMDAWAAASVLGAVAGAITTPWLTIRGLAQLQRRHAASRSLDLVSALAGCVAGAVAIVAGHRAGIWWIVPALLIWACALAAAAACDAVTQRIPTALVRQAGIGTGGLLLVGLGVEGDWRGLIVSGTAAGASGLTMLVCWRFAGAGFGDVRIAVLGGLGLGHATHLGLAIALVAISLITLIQAAAVLVRGGTRQTRFPYGPALATGFLLAAAL